MADQGDNPDPDPGDSRQTDQQNTDANEDSDANGDTDPNEDTDPYGDHDQPSSTDPEQLPRPSPTPIIQIAEQLPTIEPVPTRSILVNRSRFTTLSESSIDPNDIQMHYSSDTGIYRFYKTRTKDSNHRNLAKTEAFIYMVIPPDGGYAWLVLAAAFCCQIIVDGILYSIGSLLPGIGADLQVTSKETALIASAQIAPLASALINKFGFRPVAVTGGMVSSMSILIASFSQNVEMLVVFQGIIAGMSMGMIWMATSLIINYYFERYRAMVCGLASAGSGVGMILMNLLNVNVMELYGWSNTTRVHTFLLFVAGMLTMTYKEVEPTKLGHYVEFHADIDTEDSVNSVEIGVQDYTQSSMTLKSEVLKSVTSLATIGKIEGRLDILTPPAKRSLFSRICPCCSNMRKLSSTDSRRFIIRHDPLDRSDIFYDGNPDYSQSGVPEPKDTDDIEISPGNEYKARTIMYTFSVIRVPPQIEEEKPWCPQKIKTAIHALLDLALLRLPEFRLILLESLLYPMGYNIPYVYSAQRAEIEEDIAKLLPVAIGVTNIVCRLLIGFLAYKITFHTAYLSGCGMIIAGSVTFLSAFVGQSSIWFQFVYVMCFGLGAASFSTTRAIVYVKVLGLEKLTNAYGLTTMVMGIGAFIGTSTAGAMNDCFEGYTVTFAFSGTVMTAAGIVKVCLPKFIMYRDRLEARKAQKKVRFAETSNRRKWLKKCCYCFYSE